MAPSGDHGTVASALFYNISMKLAHLKHKSVLILGLGVEGRSTWRYLRAAFPEQLLGVADRLPMERLSPEFLQEVERDSRLRLHLGEDYLSCLDDYDVIVKSPGLSVTIPAYRQSLAAGQQITSQTALFFANFAGTINGITGTKGKSTTASLLYAILKSSFPNTYLIGNIGVPALDVLPLTNAETKIVYELSSHQLEGLRQSPHVAVLLNIVPEHLDYYENFEQYVAAKENITRFQTPADFLIYDSDHDLPTQIASRSRAQGIACSLQQSRKPGCFLSGDALIYSPPLGQAETVAAVQDVRLPGRFNLINVAAAAAAGRLAGVPAAEIAEAVRNFQPLEHRLEYVGTYADIAYYNDSIATVPEAVIAALDTLGQDVETILLGGADRGLDFSELAKRLIRHKIKTVILFPPSGERIRRALDELMEMAPGAPSAGKKAPVGHPHPKQFFAGGMEEAVDLARQHTGNGKICLLSPASPSFGLFRDYRDRGEEFKRLVRNSGGKNIRRSAAVGERPA